MTENNLVDERSLMNRLRSVDRVLREVIVPGFDVDVISSRVVTKLRISRDGNIIGVYVDLSGSDPGCLFCRTLNESLWRRILENIHEKLIGIGFKEVIFIDHRSGMEIDLYRKYVLHPG